MEEGDEEKEEDDDDDDGTFVNRHSRCKNFFDI
jgi:hypothetical protein